MADRCTEGTHAYIIRDHAGCEENVGRVVEVIDKAGAAHGEWRVRCNVHVLKALNRVDGQIITVEPGRKVFMPDSWLLPLGQTDGAPDRDMRATADEPEEVSA